MVASLTSRSENREILRAGLLALVNLSVHGRFCKARRATVGGRWRGEGGTPDPCGCRWDQTRASREPGCGHDCGTHGLRCRGGGAAVSCLLGTGQHVSPLRCVWRSARGLACALACRTHSLTDMLDASFPLLSLCFSLWGSSARQERAFGCGGRWPRAGGCSVAAAPSGGRDDPLRLPSPQDPGPQRP